MKTRLLIIVALIAFVAITPSLAYGLVIPRSAEEILKEGELIILGTITYVKFFDDKPPEFQIEIEEVIILLHMNRIQLLEKK